MRTIEQQALLRNLPAELLRQPRFFPVRIINGQKVPCVKAWQLPENQMEAQDAIKATGLIGMDICGHGRGADYFFADFDHVFDGNGNFVFDDADRWDNFLSMSETYRELSISGEGLHFIFAPNPNKFPVLKGGNANHAIFFDDQTHSKIELFFKTPRYVLLTGAGAANTDIVSGEVADEFCQQLVNQLACDLSQIKDDTADDALATDTDIPLHEVRKMLAAIDCAQSSYGDWFKAGAILHYHFGEAGFELWQQWSESDKTPGRYTLENCKEQWRRIVDRAKLKISRPAKIGSLIRYAQQFGYKLPRRTKQSANRHEDLNFFFEGKSSDLQFAYRLERFCGNRVRWLDDERWLVFNSGLWQRLSEKNSAVATFGRQLADTMSRYAETKDERELAEKFQSAKKIGCAIGLLKSIDSIRINADDLDRHNELLNCLNGVVNLQDGKLYPHAPELLLTQQCRAEFDANANSPLVEKFFRDIMPDEQTRAGLLRWLGYCLTGETSAEKFMIWHGLGKNGKGVLSRTLLYLLDNYGAGLAPRALLKTSRPIDANNATTALNALEGARFAISEELPADAELDASLVKNLTGGDKINLRRNFGEYRTIEHRAKLNISGNYLPRIENTADEGLLRRMLSMPFGVNFGTPQNPADETLKKKMLLPEHLRGLLNVLVREAVCWYRGDDGGLIISPQMSAEREKLLRQSDFVGEFVDDFYIRSASASVKAKDFLDDLKRAYPRECSRFSRADLIKLVERAAGVTYGEDRKRNRIFTGIGKAAPDDFGGEPISSSDYNPYD